MAITAMTGRRNSRSATAREAVPLRDASSTLRSSTRSVLAHMLATGAIAAFSAGAATAQTGYGTLPVPLGGPRAAATNAPGWHVVPELDAELDFTDNADLAPSGARRSD